MRFRVLPTITITWKNHENCSHTSKKVPDIAPGTHWWEENLTCMIFLSHASAEAPTATCAIILSQPAKTGCFHSSTHYIAQYRLHLKIPICFSQRCLKWRLCIATEELFLADWTIWNMKHETWNGKHVLMLIIILYIYNIIYNIIYI